MTREQMREITRRELLGLAIMYGASSLFGLALLAYAVAASP